MSSNKNKSRDWVLSAGDYCVWTEIALTACSILCIDTVELGIQLIST